MIKNISIKDIVTRMPVRLRDDETLVDGNDTPLYERKHLLQALKRKGIRTVEEFMNIKDWSRFDKLPKESIDLLQQNQEIRKATGIHFSNPYVIR